MKLNLACEDRKLPGYLNVDIDRRWRPDVVADALRLPFKDSMFEEVNASNFFEHISDTVGLMEEIHRVLQDRGMLRITAPHFSSRSVWAVPDHVKGFGFTTFERFTPENVPKHYKPSFRIVNKRIFYDTMAWNFNVPALRWFYRAFVKFADAIANRHPDFVERYLVYWLGGYDSIYVEMAAIKQE